MEDAKGAEKGCKERLYNGPGETHTHQAGGQGSGGQGRQIGLETGRVGGAETRDGREAKRAIKQASLK